MKITFLFTLATACVIPACHVLLHYIALLKRGVAWFVTQKVSSFKPVAVLLKVFLLSAMVKTLLYPGGVKALSEIECLEARTVQEHFVDQCAVIWYVLYSGKFSSLPKSLKEELGADIFNMIDASRVYTMDRSEVVMHAHFSTKDACKLAVQKMRKRQAKVIGTCTPSFKMFPMYTSSNRYSIYTLKLPLDSPSNAMEKINKALASTERDIIDVVLGEDKVLKNTMAQHRLFYSDRATSTSLYTACFLPLNR